MAGPSPTEYATATAAAYNISAGTFTPPAGWTVVASSAAAQQASGFAAVAMRDPSGNVIIANEGIVGVVSNSRISSISASVKNSDVVFEKRLTVENIEALCRESALDQPAAGPSSHIARWHRWDVTVKRPLA